MVTATSALLMQLYSSLVLIRGGWVMPIIDPSPNDASHASPFDDTILVFVITTSGPPTLSLP